MTERLNNNKKYLSVCSYVCVNAGVYMFLKVRPSRNDFPQQEGGHSIFTNQNSIQNSVGKIHSIS